MLKDRATPEAESHTLGHRTELTVGVQHGAME